MDHYFCVASRTRSKNNSPLFSFSKGSSSSSSSPSPSPSPSSLAPSSSEEKMASGSGKSESSRKRKGNRMEKRVGVFEPDVVFLGESMCEEEKGSVSCNKVDSEGVGEKIASGSGASSSIFKGRHMNKSGLKGEKIQKCELDSVGKCEGERMPEVKGKKYSVSCSKGASAGAIEKMETLSGTPSSSISKRGQRNKSGMNGKKVCKSEPAFVFLGEDEEVCGVLSSNKRMKGLVVEPEPNEVIEIDDSDDDGIEKGLEHCEKKGFEDDVDVDEEDQNEKGKGSCDFADKVENFGNVGCGFGPENANHVTIVLDGDSDSEEENGETESDSEFDSDYISSSTDNDRSSDEDFKVDDEKGYSSSEDGSSSYDDEDEKERRGRYGRRGSLQKEAKGSAKIFKRRENEKERRVKGESDKSDANTNANDFVNIDDDKGKEHPNKGTGVKSVSTLRKNQEKKGDSGNILKRKENENERDSKESENNDANANANDFVNIDAAKGKEHSNKSAGVTSASTLLKNQEKKGDSAKILKRKGKGKERGDNMDSEENDAIANANANDYLNIDAHKVHRMQSKPKELRLLELLAECFAGKHNSNKDGSNELEVKHDDVHWRDTKPPASGQLLPMKFTFGRVEQPVEKSESEKELDRLWEEMEYCLRLIETDSLVGNAGIDEAEQSTGSPAFRCKHDLYLDEETGMVCRFCLWIAVHIKDILPPMEEEFPSKRSGKRTSSDEVNVSLFDGAEFDVSGGDKEAVWSHKEGTVWDLIPDLKGSFYPHQQEGLEFIWTNLAGTINLQKLKIADPCSAGGCIISHAPGTGKTRLTIVFLQTYLEVFPKCRPIIIAPANLLLTWEDEFKKWNIGIPFHNMNKFELSGKEHVAAADKVDWSKNPQQNKDAIRMVKLYSWFKEKSILGISYHLYEKLAGEESTVDSKIRKRNRKMRNEKKNASTKNKGTGSRVMGKILRDNPDLLILDEGHTPRNQGSLIWKVLSEVQTPKRVILSGTPFQNTFLELYNTLCLAKPTFPDRIPQELKKFCQSRLIQEKKPSKDWSWEPVSSGNRSGNPADAKIEQLKLLMDPFVHVYKGSILQKNLPGLRECMVTLKPDNLQKELLHSIECSQNVMRFNHRLALVSVHPSLFLKCSLSEKEESVFDRAQLEELELNPYGGIKTRFLVEFVRLCEALDEKVLVFSQFKAPLELIRKQLKSVFNWSEGKEVLYMHGQLDKTQKQSLIHGFNDANSKAKVLLASTKACSEGINLIGASRVVLLDVVWNPSVERQAISRAYRLGQKRVVYTYHLITENEYAKYYKQTAKDRMSERVFSDKNTENDEQKSSAVVLEDKVLDHMVRHDKLKDIFVDCMVSPKETDLFESLEDLRN